MPEFLPAIRGGRETTFEGSGVKSRVVCDCLFVDVIFPTSVPDLLLLEQKEKEMNISRIALVGVVAGAGLALGAAANGDLVDNGDGTSTFYLSFDDSDIVGDGQIYGGVEAYSELAGAEILAIGWSDLEVSSSNPLSPFNGDNFWALFLMNGGGGAGWYYGVPFGGESASTLGPASGGFDVTGAGFSVLDDGSIGVGYADIGGAGDVVTGTMSGDILIVINGTIPTPGALALLGIAGLTGMRRRR